MGIPVPKPRYDELVLGLDLSVSFLRKEEGPLNVLYMCMYICMYVCFYKYSWERREGPQCISLTGCHKLRANNSHKDGLVYLVCILPNLA
jgi:hypothetical protein